MRPIRSRRSETRFEIADPALVYLDGNSLGRLPRATRDRVDAVLARWGERIVRGWEDGWLDLPLTVGDRLGAAALGAAAGQVAVADSTTVCFYKLVAAALDARPEPHRDRHRRRQLPDRSLRARGARRGPRPDDPLAAVRPGRRPDGGGCRRRRSPSGPRSSRSRTSRTCPRTSPSRARSTRSPTTPARSRCGTSATASGRSRSPSTPTAPTSPSAARTST